MAGNTGFVIAIDGPVASGKGTIASQLAKDLNAFYLYTGALYRAVALLCINKSIDMEDRQAVVSVLQELSISYKDTAILLNDEDITERINEQDTASGASVVGVYHEVRKAVDQQLQRTAQDVMASGKIVIAEGRDMGTTVFPESPFKVYLTARPEVRARRRMEQYLRKNTDLTKEIEELKKRDKRDTERAASPLPSNPEELGYFILDNSDMTEQQTLDAIKTELKKRELAQ